ncbi:hypothetical protein HK102_009704 [Quaeritorhiza haematococci]|nr:hypothetical protein HK102_009704 [Quaeritorhiza haematococci]
MIAARKPGGIPDATGREVWTGGGGGGGSGNPGGGGSGFVTNPNAAIPFVEAVQQQQQQHHPVLVNALVCISSRKRLSGTDGAKDEFTTWPAFLTDDNETMVLQMPDDHDWETSAFGFKECVAAVLELAEEVLHRNNLIVCLKKDRADLGK